MDGESVNIWRLQTGEDPLAAARRFLGLVWRQADLDGMLVLRYQPGAMSIQPELIDDPGQLETADPFVPLMQVNLASQVEQVRQHLRGAWLWFCVPVKSGPWLKRFMRRR
jgi:hypothetical protein